MTSSDSGEDFESADEDFDNDFTDPTHKAIIEETESILHVEENPKQVESLSTTSTTEGRGDPCVTLDFDQTNISNDLEQNIPENIDTGLIVNTNTTKTHLASASVSCNSSTCDEVKPIITVKTNECEQLQTDKSSLLVDEIERIQHDEPLLENLKIGDGWDIEDEDGIQLPDTPVKISSKVIETPTVMQGYEHNSDSLKIGDGWDIEEEDGFEIPVSLVNTSDAHTAMESSHSKKLTDTPLKEQESEDCSQGWGGWGGWGVSSLLSTATGSVSTFSSQVTAGLSTVLETTVGAPAPEALAAASVKNNTTDDGNKETAAAEETSSSSSYVGFGSIVSGVSLFGSTVINHGLDTLESLGKKTMEVLQEGDPGLMKKRAILFPNQDKPVLSQILREAKEKADHSEKEKEEKETARKAHFESLFDDFQGMVHLEALEMLSTQCSLKLQTQMQSHSGRELEDFQETLSQVQDLCELADDDDDVEALSQDQFSEQIISCVAGLKVNISAAKIIQVNNGVIGRLSELQSAEGSASLVNQSAISSLAEFTAAAMECFHKSAELLLAKKLHNTADEAENYIQLTNHLCARVSAIANDFSQLLTKNNPISNSSIITNIFLEASNSSSYIKNACQLLVPILQVGAVSS